MNIIVVGGGQTGSYVTELLISRGEEVFLIEEDELIFKRLREKFPSERLLLGSGANPDLLEKANISRAEMVLALTGSDEINLVVATLAKKEYDVNKVVGRINNPKNEWLYTEEMGVDLAFNQGRTMAGKILEEVF